MDGVIKQLYDVLKDLEWAGNLTDDSWGVITIACPSCRNAKKDGHKVDCKLNEALKEREAKTSVVKPDSPRVTYITTYTPKKNG